MLYLLAILLPPLAVLICGKPIQALLNLILTIFCVWIGGVLHAVMIVADAKADERNRRLVDAIQHHRR